MVNIQTSGGFVSETAFEGAYKKRISKRESETTERAYKQTDKISVQEQLGEGVCISISPESQEFVSGVEDRKAYSVRQKTRCGSKVLRILLRIAEMLYLFVIWKLGNVWHRNRPNGVCSVRICIVTVSMTA